MADQPTQPVTAEPAPAPGGEVGRFLAFAACQRDDTDRAICDAFYRAFVRLEEQLDATQRRMDAGARAFERVCFARDRFAEQLDEIIKRDNEEAIRIERLASSLIGRNVPEQTSAKNLTVIEEGVYALRQRIDRLEAEREPVADCAGEGDVEDLIDACAGLTERGPEWDLWARRHLTAKALDDAWQEERQRRGQAEQDAERWHRLFDEGATLTERVTAERDRLAAEVERLTASLEGMRLFAESRGSLLRAAEVERDRLAAEVERLTGEHAALRAKLADVEKDRARLDGDVRAASHTRVAAHALLDALTRYREGAIAERVVLAAEGQLREALAGVSGEVRPASGGLASEPAAGRPF